MGILFARARARHAAEKAAQAKKTPDPAQPQHSEATQAQPPAPPPKAAPRR